MEYKKTAKIALGFILAVFLLPKTLFATTIQDFPTITAEGTVSNINCSLGSTIFGFRHYAGTPFTVEGTYTSTVANSNCSAVSAGAGNLEDGYFNNTSNTPDGESWVEMAFSGSANNPDWNGNKTYFKAYRQNGIWVASYGVVFATSTIPAFFTDDTATSTLQSLEERCSDSSNIFSEGLCMASVFLFIPSNESIGQFSTLTETLRDKFPFSYINSITDTWSGLTASSTANSPAYTFNLANTTIGSTTPMGVFLPNITVFSSSTVQQYFPAGTFDVLKTLAGIAIILTLMADIFFTSRNLIKS